MNGVTIKIPLLSSPNFALNSSLVVSLRRAGIVIDYSVDYSNVNNQNRQLSESVPVERNDTTSFRMTGYCIEILY